MLFVDPKQICPKSFWLLSRPAAPPSSRDVTPKLGEGFRGKELKIGRALLVKGGRPKEKVGSVGRVLGN